MLRSFISIRDRSRLNYSTIHRPVPIGTPVSSRQAGKSHHAFLGRRQDTLAKTACRQRERLILELSLAEAVGRHDATTWFTVALVHAQLKQVRAFMNRRPRR